MKTNSFKDRVIATAIAGAGAYLLFNTPAQSQSQYTEEYNRQLQLGVERNIQQLERETDAYFATPRQQPTYIYSPAGQPQGYIIPDRNGQPNLYGNEGDWRGTLGE